MERQSVSPRARQAGRALLRRKEAEPPWPAPLSLQHLSRSQRSHEESIRRNSRRRVPSRRSQDSKCQCEAPRTEQPNSYSPPCSHSFSKVIVVYSSPIRHQRKSWIGSKITSRQITLERATSSTTTLSCQKVRARALSYTLCILTHTRHSDTPYSTRVTRRPNHDW